MTEAPAGPLILTLQLDPASQARFDRERQQHFPSSLNVVPAHVTLFHALPPQHAAEIGQALTDACATLPPVPFTVTGVRFLGRGSAYALDMPQIAALQARLAAQWRTWLTPQDRQPWHPHVTVQNKVEPAAAKQLHARLMAGFLPHEGLVTGLRAWEYLGGPWRAWQTFPFGEPPP